MIADVDIADIASLVSGTGTHEQTIADLRKAWPGLHFTLCHDDDICAAQPVQSHDGFNLYLVTGAGGCIGFTSDKSCATGIVIAETDMADANLDAS